MLECRATLASATSPKRCKALQSASGVSSAVVDLASQNARVEGSNLDANKLIVAVEEEGYQAQRA